MNEEGRSQGKARHRSELKRSVIGVNVDKEKSEKPPRTATGSTPPRARPGHRDQFSPRALPPLAPSAKSQN